MTCIIILNSVRQQNNFITLGNYKVTCFDYRLVILSPFANCVTRCYAHFGIPSCLHPWNTSNDLSVDKKNQLDVTFCQVRLAGSASIGRTTCQPDLTTFLQPRHIPTQGYNITQSSAPDDGHMVARNMSSNH